MLNKNPTPDLHNSTPAPTNWRGLGCVLVIIACTLAAAIFVQVSDLIAMHG